MHHETLPNIKDSVISKRIEGTVIWYSIDEGYGIIRQAHNKQTISIDQSQIHYNSLEEIRPLCIGDKVSFVIKGLSARDLYIL